MKKQELLAPAGDIEAGYAALYYGADAVYLGLSKFSARANATNFDEPALDEFTAYAHFLKRKVYVALNTLLQEGELPELIKSLDICTRCHVDGLIIQDLGVARVMKEQYPWFEMHASTQMAVHNKEGALFLKKMGFKRVVLARELTLSEIKEIAAIPDLETEVFIHGALCYSYSGICQFSAMEYGRSANRGKCMYPCRAEFLCNGKKSHLFSMKDMALEKDVLKLPADSLKIEGRKKSALYVAAVTDYYRHILDGDDNVAKIAENIKQIFSRPWCKFHFNGKDKNIIDRNFVGHRGLHIGKVEGVAHNRLYFKTLHKISRYDGLQIDVAGDEKPFGFSVQKLCVNHKSVFSADKGCSVEIELPNNYPTLSKGENVYLASSSEVKGAYDYEKPKPNLYKNTNKINVEVNVSNEDISACCDNFEFSVTGKFLPAENPEKSLDAIRKAFAKTGDTKFELSKLTINNPQNLFVPASLANELRRGLYAKIKPEIKQGKLPETDVPLQSSEKRRFVIKVDNLDYLKLIDLENIAEIVWLINPQSDISRLNELPKNKIRIALPTVCRHPKIYEKIIAKLLSEGYKKWEIGNYWGFSVLPDCGLDIATDTSLYMLNTQAMQMAKDMGVSIVNLSVEDNCSNICNIANKSQIKTSVVIYQNVPLFNSVGCIRDNDCKNCEQGEKWFDLAKDGKKFKALSRDCQMMIFDDRPYCIASEAAKINADFLRMDFCYMPYSAENVKSITDKLMCFEDIKDSMKANFLNNNL